MARGERSSVHVEVKELLKLRGEFEDLLQASDRRGARRLLRAACGTIADPQLLMREVVSPAVDEVSGAWPEHRVSLSQVYAVGLIIEDSMELLATPAGEDGRSQGTLVIGTAVGDYHGLGKRIVAAFLRAAGFAVVDLGLSVTPEAFAEAAQRERAQIVAVSALMADTALAIRQVREEMDRRRIQGMRLLVGGAPFRFNPALVKLVGADASAANAFEATGVAKGLVAAVR